MSPNGTKLNSMEISINQNHFTLHHSGGIYWQEQHTLLISDVHLGKIAHFRKHGLAVPLAAVQENFNRLDEVLGLFNPGTVIFLGDLFHSEINNEWQFFCDWVNKTKVEIILVEGNHDIIARRHYCDLDILIFPKLEIDRFLFTHHPTATEGFFNFCGHIHPGVKVRDVGRQSLKLPCFFRKENQLILPAFGEFTGNFFLRPNANDQAYAIAGKEVIPVF